MLSILPSKYFPNYIDIKSNRFTEIMHWWLDHGIRVEGMQSLLYGKPRLNLFGDAETQRRLILHLSKICEIANALNCQKLVFGSPPTEIGLI